MVSFPDPGRSIFDVSIRFNFPSGGNPSAAYGMMHLADTAHEQALHHLSRKSLYSALLSNMRDVDSQQ
jgi:hypothetical protein